MLLLCLNLLFLGALIQAELYQPGTPGMYLYYVDVFSNYIFKGPEASIEFIKAKFLELSRNLEI